jgi:hypothetical protein
MIVSHVYVQSRINVYDDRSAFGHEDSATQRFHVLSRSQYCALLSYYNSYLACRILISLFSRHLTVRGFV